MSAQPVTLVTAAAGKTGRHTALSLLSRGLPVRAMVHREDITRSVVTPAPNRRRYLRTLQGGAPIGALSIDSDLWQTTHAPDRMRDVQIGATSTVAR